MSKTIKTDFEQFISRFQLVPGTNQNDTKSIGETVNTPEQVFPDILRKALNNRWIYNRDGDLIETEAELRQYLTPVQDENGDIRYNQLYFRDRNARPGNGREESIYATRTDGHIPFSRFTKNEVLDVRDEDHHHTKTAHTGEQRPTIPKMNIFQKIFSALTFGHWKPTKVRRAERGIAAYDASRLNAAKKLGFTMTPEEDEKINALGHLTREQRQAYAYDKTLPAGIEGPAEEQHIPQEQQVQQEQHVNSEQQKQHVNSGQQKQNVVPELQGSTLLEQEKEITMATQKIILKLRSFDQQKLMNDQAEQNINHSDTESQVADILLHTAGVYKLLQPQGDGPKPQDDRKAYLENLQKLSKMSLDELLEFGKYMLPQSQASLPDNATIANEINRIKFMEIKPKLPVAPIVSKNSRPTILYTAPSGNQIGQDQGKGLGMNNSNPS